MTEIALPNSKIQHLSVVLVSALPCLLVPSALCFLGYGAYVRIGFVFIFPVLITLSWGALSLVRVIVKFYNLRRTGGPFTTPALTAIQKCGLLLIFLLALGISWAIGIQARYWYGQSIGRKAQPLIEALEAYRREHGRYPLHIEELPEYQSLSKVGPLIFRQGKFLKSSLLDVGRIEDADLTVYLTSDRYLCVVPLEKKLLMSITRFYVLERASNSPEWIEDHIIWTLEPS